MSVPTEKPPLIISPPAGARFGPRGIRAASARQSKWRGFNHRAGLNPYMSPLRLLDCGDIPITPFSSQLALKQMTAAFAELLDHPTALSSNQTSGDEVEALPPKLLTLGGDHSIVLPVLRAFSKKYGEPISVLHFDAHLDTWRPGVYPGGEVWDPDNEESEFNHGSMFWMAGNEGLIARNTSVHAGLRTRLTGPGWDDYEDDERQGWMRISTDEIDDEGGLKRIVKRILEKIGTQRRVYISVDIDVIDPGLAPATGTPEAGGWTTRELINILRGLEDLNIIGADVVEVAPAYDWAETTSLAAAQVSFELLTSMVKTRLRKSVLTSQDPQRDPKDEL